MSAPAATPQLYPTPRQSLGLSDGYTDMLGGEPLQSNMCGTNAALNAGNVQAVFTVQSGGPTGRKIVIPENMFGGNVTWVRGLYSLAAVPRYQAFMADFPSNGTNYVDFNQPATNSYAGGVLSTTVPVLSSVAVGTQLQAYYSYRDGTRSIKGQAMSGWPQLHVDPYQGTANDGDNYLMLSFYHAYLTTKNPRYKDLADRIGLALLDAGRWDSNHIRFDIPFEAEAGQVGFYSYSAPTTPFTVSNDEIGLRIQAQVDSGGPPWNYAGFGFWPTLPIRDGAVFRSVAITLLGDGSGRSLEVNLNISPTKSASEDYYCRITLLPQDAHAYTRFVLTPDDFWQTGNVVYDAAHQDFSYVGTYGSDVSYLGTYTDPIQKRTIAEYHYDFTGNSVGYAGMYMGPASASSAGTEALKFDLRAVNEAVLEITATDANDVDHSVYISVKPGWQSFAIPWVGTRPIPMCHLYSGDWCSWQPSKTVALFYGADIVGFSQDTFAHPVQQITIEAVAKSPVFISQGSGGPNDIVIYHTTTVNSIAIDHMRYDEPKTLGQATPDRLNGIQISFPSNDLGTPYDVTVESIDFDINAIDGPPSDPERYMGIPRWTYKWTMKNGYIGYGSWRGPSAVGYNWLGGWYWSGIVNPDNGRVVSQAMMDFMADSQAAYHEQFPSLPQGPFMPRYGRPSWEAITTEGYIAGSYVSGTYNKWYHPDTDDWYGYMYRAVLSVAQYYHYNPTSQAKGILDKWMTWLDSHIIADGAYWKPPADFYSDGTVGYSYRPVYAYACIASACIYKYWVDGDPIAQKWGRRLLDDMYARKRLTATGALMGIYPVSEGSHYTYANVTVTGNGTGATATAFIAGGKITHYEVTNGGSGYTWVSVSITGDGTGAVGDPYLNDQVVGAFDPNHTGWECAEVANAYSLMVNGPRPGGVANYALTATANDLAAYTGLLAFYARNTRDSRPSMLTAAWLPIHEYAVDPYHNGSGIENPMSKDTHAKGAAWTETLGPTVYMAVEYGRYCGDWSWLDTLYAHVVEFTGTYRSKAMAVFPSLAGLTWNSTKTPNFNTRTHRAASGYEVRAALMQYPLWRFSLSYEFLRDNVANNELKTLMGFFLSRKGSFEAFLYSDPDDNSVVNQNFGVGNGTWTSFQLNRVYGGFTEPVHNVNGTPTIYVNGVAKTLGTDYSISATGLVTFVSPPAAGVPINWSGSYYYRVRFVDDHASFNKFMYALHELKQVEFVGSPMNKV